MTLLANWTAPSNIGALTTTRTSGHSLTPYDQNNLAMHVGDDPMHVTANRIALMNSLQLPGEPIWLEQTHSNHCVVVEEDSNRIADAAITRNKRFPLAIMTADCLPILLCNNQGTEIAAIHAGWRGLVNGIIENTLAKMQSQPTTLLAWVGPSICQNCFEIGKEVEKNYLERYPFTASAFHTKASKRYANLAKMAELILNSQQVTTTFQSAACTYEQKNHFYSYRREAQTGRITTLVWFKE